MFTTRRMKSTYYGISALTLSRREKKRAEHPAARRLSPLRRNLGRILHSTGPLFTCAGSAQHLNLIVAPETPRLNQLVNESENARTIQKRTPIKAAVKKEQWDPHGIQIDARFHVSQTSASSIIDHTHFIAILVVCIRRGSS
jgi:hypothetical protein